MSCGCGTRAVKALKAMGYVEEDGFLTLGEHHVTIEEAEEHHASVTLTAMKEKAKNWARRFNA